MAAIGRSAPQEAVTVDRIKEKSSEGRQRRSACFPSYAFPSPNLCKSSQKRPHFEAATQDVRGARIGGKINVCRNHDVLSARARGGARFMIRLVERPSA